MKPSEYAKALVAGLVPGVLLFFTLRSGGVTADEWQAIIAIVLAASGITWAVPNAPKTPPVPTPDVWTPPRPLATGGFVTPGKMYFGESGPESATFATDGVVKPEPEPKQ